MRHLRFLLLTLALAAPLGAQQDTSRLPTGVRLGLTYQTLQRAKLAVRDFGSRPQDSVLAAQITGIVRRDLDYSDRFAMASFIPAALAGRGAVDFKAWNGLGVVWLITGDVVPDSTGVGLHVVAYDIVYGSVKQAQNFPLPDPASPGFRMGVHRAADAIVQWLSGQPGIAATRIAYTVRNTDGSWALRVVDSDGQNVQTVATAAGKLVSPAWTPDGTRLAFARATVRETGTRWDLLERDMATGATRVLLSRDNLLYTPAYSPDGRRLAFAVWNGHGTEIDDYDVQQRCCLRRLTPGTADDLSPSYSPDGQRLAFNSDRLGQPEIYIMPADGGDPDLISPFTYGEPGYYTSPAWAPRGNQVAFHGRSRGDFQIMLADAGRPGAPVQQITAEGRNADPSWAPDARHLVFTGVRAGGTGLYVIDVATGRVRPLLLGGLYRVPDWSPVLPTGAGAAVH
jgi:TolB protein